MKFESPAVHAGEEILAQQGSRIAKEPRQLAKNAIRKIRQGQTRTQASDGSFHEIFEGFFKALCTAATDY
jgi:hypothetical protein